jgi:hypothetical protein
VTPALARRADGLSAVKQFAESLDTHFSGSPAVQSPELSGAWLIVKSGRGTRNPPLCRRVFHGARSRTTAPKRYCDLKARRRRFPPEGCRLRPGFRIGLGARISDTITAA